MVVYVLELTGGCYYVGRTTNIEARLHAHAEGKGSEWTKLHSMVRLVKTYNDDNPFQEDMITKMTMAEYGIDKVRGGTYSQVFLPQSKYNAIVSEIRGAQGSCFRCGGPHFIRDCDIKKEPEEAEAKPLIERVVASAGRKAKRIIDALWWS